jgi:hypothetical protein
MRAAIVAWQRARQPHSTYRVEQASTQYKFDPVLRFITPGTMVDNDPDDPIEDRRPLPSHSITP